MRRWALLLALAAPVVSRAPAAADEAAKKRLLAEEGGTAETEKAVRLALDWLAAHQDEDGKIDADGFERHCPETDRCGGTGGGHHGERMECSFDAAVTAVALSAWLAGGSTRDAGPHAENVRRALPVCVREAEGDAGGFDSLWNVAFSAWAVADARVLLGGATLDATVAKARTALEAVQAPDGGWRYFAGPIGDVPTTSCVLAALGACERAGASPDPDRLARALRFLDARVDAKTGRSEYHDGAEGLGYTPTTANAASALGARAMLGRLADTPLLAKQWEAVADHKPTWTVGEKTIRTDSGPVVAQTGRAYPYAWYYATLAQFQRGGPAWSSWFGSIKTALLKGQERTGHAAGSWDPVGPYGGAGGRAFTTALCALMLESPYRYPRRR